MIIKDKNKICKGCNFKFKQSEMIVKYVINESTGRIKKTNDWYCKICYRKFEKGEVI